MAITRSLRFQFVPFFISLLITMVIAFVASLFTRPQIAGWYSTLAKPSFNPPAFLFAPVWITIYIMIATAAYIVWKHRDATATYLNASIVYVLQLLLNFSWSIIFFGMHQVLAAFVLIACLWLSIIINMYYFNKFSRMACWLLLPYLLWVSFAGTLNLYIYLLNR